MAAGLTGAGPHRVGVISDTHGLLRPEAVRALRGSALILHAGDVDSPEVLEALREIAPVVAVRGNNDHGQWAEALPETVRLTLGGVAVVMVHDVKTLRAADGAQVVVCGHSHQPRCETRAGVLYFNPGSAGPRRFRLPVSLGRLDFAGGRVRPRLVPIRPGRPGPPPAAGARRRSRPPRPRPR